jgi:hypothetical protein
VDARSYESIEPVIAREFERDEDKIAKIPKKPSGYSGMHSPGFKRRHSLSL